MTDVRIPGSAHDAKGSDLAEPAAALAIRLRLLGDEPPPGDKESTPDSVQVIQAGALFFSKSWANWVAGGTTLTALVTAAGGAFVSATTDLSAAGQAAFIAGALFVLSAGAVAVAMIVASDVRSRAAATVAQYNARAEIARAFVAAVVPSTTRGSAADDRVSATVDLAKSRSLSLALAVAAFGERVVVTPETGPAAGPVTGMRNDRKQGLEVELEGRDWVAVDDLKSFHTSDPKIDAD
ncbi:hypothetical protein WCD74_01360 [Actinomycetospora sp. OC33-EN08]|uniref:SLATT domain-containing protein n=1 Tax=Actinomycetospora aurantiaca TaxID=3129233 RepID=A0ABU8MIC0_9PSEU